MGKNFNSHWKFTTYYTKVILVGSVGAAEEVDGNPKSNGDEFFYSDDNWMRYVKPMAINFSDIALKATFLFAWALPSFAQDDACAEFGSVKFFQEKSVNEFEACAETSSDDAFFKIFENGNNIAMNAVIAGVSAEELGDILGWFSEDALTEIFEHRNFDDLSIVHLAGVAQLGPKVIVELATWGADINILKDKEKGSLLSDDRGVSALHYALSKGAPYENILALLAMGIDPNIQDKNGNIALNYAASSQLDYDTISLTMFYTDHPLENDKGYNALHFASQKMENAGALEVLYALTDPKYHSKKTESDETILHLAAAAAPSPVVFEVTLNYSEDFLCDKDKKGAQAIDYARKNPSISKSKPVLKLQNSCN